MLLSTAFHPQTDGVSERKIRDVSQILRSVVDSDQTNWAEKIPLCEFALNSSVSASTKFAPFELNYGYLPIMSTVLPLPSEFPGVQAFAEQAQANLVAAMDAIIESRVIQRHQSNQLRRPDPKIEAGDLIYLSTRNLSLPKGRAAKLAPKYVGPYKVLEADESVSKYKLELPLALTLRHIHPVFHASLLRPYYPSDPVMFPMRDSQHDYDFGLPDDREWLVEDIIGHTWEGQSPDKLKLQVKWAVSDETTWEPIASVDDLEALDRYLELHAVSDWKHLPRNA